MNSLIAFARYFTGILFIISGLIKINDPVGTQIKLQEYFEVFAADTEGLFFLPSLFYSLIPLALFFSVFLSVLEVVLGVALLVRYKLRITTTILLIIIVFFTFLTFYSAYFDKVTDCGCFGDALKLTPWQSFIKDIVLLVLILILFAFRNRLEVVKNGSTVRAIVVLAATVLSIWIAWYAIQHLPFVDFRAYKKGNNIKTLMQPSAAYKYSYIMVKDGEEFELESYPNESEGYEYKEIKLLNPEAQPVITDFAVWNNEGDYTEEVLQGNRLLIAIHTTDKADTGELGKINDLVKALQGTAASAVLTSASEADFEAFRHTHQLAIPYYFTDATVLKTIIRSNPGLILLQNGAVMGKWHYNDVPGAEKVKEILR